MRSASDVYTRDMADTGRCEQSAAPAGRQRQWACVRRAGLWQHIGVAGVAGGSHLSWDMMVVNACLATCAARRTAGTGLLRCSLSYWLLPVPSASVCGIAVSVGVSRGRWLGHIQECVWPAAVPASFGPEDAETPSPGWALQRHGKTHRLTHTEQ
jgi:hypothetical protein